MGSMGIAVAVDVGLMLLFGLQHSVMARPGFKRAWTRVVPEEMERSAYVLHCRVSCWLSLMWAVASDPDAGDLACRRRLDRGARLVRDGCGRRDPVVGPRSSSTTSNYSDCSKAGCTLRGAALRTPAFVTPLLYKIVRHPLYIGWFLIFWGAPTMSAGHLLFSAGMSAYILIAIRFEERDLVEHIGEPYRPYQAQVPALIPVPGRRSSG